MFQDDMWSSIVTLSQLDKKTVGGCVSKVFEEGGELARKAQGFEGMDGAHHRITTAEGVLEECVDGVLANLSIAIKLGFDHDDVRDMLQRKITKWANLQRSQALMNEKIPYEIHVTVEEAQLDAFRALCHQLKVKPIVLALQSTQGTIRDVMTSSTHMGNNQTALAEMQRIAQGLREAGLTVLREKIETVPWHPAAPSDEFEQTDMPKDCYFESHIGVLIDHPNTHAALSVLCRNRNLHLSRNAFKTYDNGYYRIMITYRAYTGTREAFQRELDQHVSALSQLQTHYGEPVQLDKIITEFALFDSRVHHDAQWLSQHPIRLPTPHHTGE